MIQLEVLKEIQPIPDLAVRMIMEGMDMLSRRQFTELSSRMGVSVNHVRQIAKFIGENLNPFPARSHWGDVRQGEPAKEQVYYQPDILISRLNEGVTGNLVVEIILPLRGTLRVNPLFKKAIPLTNEEQRDGMKEDFEKALLFVKCLQQRNHTMERLMQLVAGLQKDFILHGEKYLKPVTRAKMARELDVHESTISRAVSNKSVQLPNGHIIPLADFFDRSLGVRTVLKDIIVNEPHPLSDSELVDLLAEKGYSVARRTVAKYRAIEGILPANLRNAT